MANKDDESDSSFGRRDSSKCGVILEICAAFSNGFVDLAIKYMDFELPNLVLFFATIPK